MGLGACLHGIRVREEAESQREGVPEGGSRMAGWGDLSFNSQAPPPPVLSAGASLHSTRIHPGRRRLCRAPFDMPRLESAAVK